MKKNYNYDYVYGNTVRKLQPEYDYEEGLERVSIPTKEERERELEEERLRRSRRRRARRQEAPSIDLVSMLFLTVAIVITLCVCVQYLKVQADITNMSKDVASMESKIVTLRNENNAEVESITAAIDLSNIYKIATKELGMVHPEKNQVITYESTKSNAVKQYGDIPKNTEKNIVNRILRNE